MRFDLLARIKDRVPRRPRAAAVAAIRAAATRPKRYSFGDTGLQDIIR